MQPQEISCCFSFIAIQQLQPQVSGCFAIERPAIMTATNANFSLQLIVESFSTGSKQVAPATIHNYSFKLIDALASEGALFAPYIFENAFNYANKLNHEREWAQAASL
jgi:hypothetical protein